MNSNDSIAELTETVGEKATKRIQSLSAMRELNQLYFVTQDGRVYGGVWNPSPVGFNVSVRSTAWEAVRDEGAGGVKVWRVEPARQLG